MLPALDGRLVCALDPCRGELSSFAVVPSHSKTSVYTTHTCCNPWCNRMPFHIRAFGWRHPVWRGILLWSWSVSWHYRLYITIRLYSCVECVHICLVWGAHTGALLLWYSVNASIHACLSYLHCVWPALLPSCLCLIHDLCCLLFMDYLVLMSYLCLHMYVWAQSLTPGGAWLWPADDCVRGECERSSTPLHCDCLWRSALPWIGHVPLWGRFWDHPLHWWLQVLTYSVGISIWSLHRLSTNLSLPQTWCLRSVHSLYVHAYTRQALLLYRSLALVGQVWWHCSEENFWAKEVLHR